MTEQANEKPRGRCGCGCGAAVRRRFRQGHHTRVTQRPASGPNQVFTGVAMTPRGYRTVTAKGFEHRLIVESVLGRKLPKAAVIHHVNGDKADNRHSNLVVCDSQAYHILLHQRQRALHACGNPDFRKCAKCRRWGADVSPVDFKNGRQLYHAACAPMVGSHGDWDSGICGRGHDITDPANVYVGRRGNRACRACIALRRRAV